MLYSSTGVSGLVTVGGKGPDGHSILHNCFIPNPNANQYIGIGLVRGSGVLRTKSLECGSNGCIILGGGAGALVCFTGLLGCTACGGVVPSSI